MYNLILGLSKLIKITQKYIDNTEMKLYNIFISGNKNKKYCAN